MGIALIAIAIGAAYSQCVSGAFIWDDDLLVARIGLEHVRPTAAPFYPVLCEEYPGDEAKLVDGHQAQWRESLLCAIPALSESDRAGVRIGKVELALGELAREVVHRQIEIEAELAEFDA